MPAQDEAALTVEEVWSRHGELEGKRIRVAGFVDRCYGLGCQLKQIGEGSDAKWLGIGTSAEFDGAVQAYLGKSIVVEGQLDATCLHAYADEDDGLAHVGKDYTVICTDRSSMLKHPKLISVGL
ncbi:MAG: hypothetical protein M3Q57_03195 [Pseudomonadota bacterium]|nr:hypothetical protein [Pseudomonadota bacterium]